MRRALISVYDKTGIVDFAKKLTQLGWEIISTGGTRSELKKNNIEVIDITDITEFPECFGGRVKTLNPKIHGGLLALRDNKEHKDTMNELDISEIDMVVNNLYPFKETILNEDMNHEDAIENIDIGGPSMLRAAAKNYKFVTVIVDPKDYDKVIDELSEDKDTSYDTRLLLASKAFNHTSHYDTLIATYFNKCANVEFPDTISLTYEKKQDLRYGENPHQKAAFYSEITDLEGTISNAKQLHGKAMSFNNISDSNSAIEIIKDFEEPTAVAVKHGNPCGIASAEVISDAFKKAHESDPTSIFGGIVALNRELDELTANMINEIFIEIVIAPSFTDKALEILKTKKNIRILSLPKIEKNDYHNLTMTRTLGGMLIQERNTKIFNKEDIKIVTKKKPTYKEIEDLYFALKAVKETKSNAIVIAKDKTTVAVGPGQVSRIWALQNAIRQGGDKVEGAVMASDAFFPFPDCVEQAHKAGVTAIIQPGGSIKDQESIDMADKCGMSMIITGTRHFKH